MDRSKLKRGETYLVKSGAYLRGEKITLEYDDGSDRPAFVDKSGMQMWIYLKDIEPLAPSTFSRIVSFFKRGKS